MPQRKSRPPQRNSRTTTAMRKRLRSLEQKADRLLREIKLASRQLTAGSAAPMAGLNLRSRVRRSSSR